MTKTNAELAYKVLDQIDAQPEKWNQNWWFTVTECGTAACFAGWACLLSGDKMLADRETDNEISYVEHAEGGASYASVRACSLLGIDSVDAMILFDADNDREELGKLVLDIFGPRSS